MTSADLATKVRRLHDLEFARLKVSAEHALQMGDAYIYVDPRVVLNLLLRAGVVPTDEGAKPEPTQSSAGADPIRVGPPYPGDA